MDTARRPQEHAGAIVRLARERDLPLLASVIARAFDDDPLMNWVVQQDEKRSWRIRCLLEMTLRYETFPHGHVYTTAGVVGGALWAPPSRWKQPLWRELLHLPRAASAIGLRRLPRVLHGLSLLDEKHPKMPRWYLSVLGVLPEYQGRGLGSMLMGPVLERADDARQPAYLESSKERNVPLYERHGFRVTEVIELPGGPPVWLMWREPHA